MPKKSLARSNERFSRNRSFSLFNGKLIPNYNNFAKKFEIDFPIEKLPDLFEIFSITVNKSSEKNTGWIIDPLNQEITKVINLIPLGLKISFFESAFGYFSKDDPKHETHENALLMPLITPTGNGLVCTHCLNFGTQIYILEGLHPYITYERTVEMLGLYKEISITNYTGYSFPLKVIYPIIVFDHLKPVNIIEWMTNKRKIDEKILKESKYIINGNLIPFNELICKYLDTIETLEVQGPVIKILESESEKFKDWEKWFIGED